MTARWMAAPAVWMCLAAAPAPPLLAQSAPPEAAGRWIDPERGLTLDEATTRALAR